MFQKIMLTLAILISGLSVCFAGPDVAVKYSGPSGQGDMIWYCPTNGQTSLVINAHGSITHIAGNGELLTNLTGTASPSGTAINALNLLAGTNYSAANLRVGTAASAINGAAITNLTVDNMAVSSGAKLTNTCLAADGKTNTYVFTPFGTGRYILTGVTTSP